MKDLTLDAIADAVAKQQPKKVITKTTYYEDLVAYDTYEMIETTIHLCPRCKTNLFHNPKYCEHCGQKLDWRILG